MESIKKYAWYFPNWHPTPLNDRWHGKNWTEWECVKCARPRFEGHEQPKVPLWGYEDESDPAVFAKKIDTAHKYGIDGFIFDFYWFKEEGPYRRDCLEKGFLGAPNNELCEFSVMWCNHDPIYAHPAAYMHKGNELASGFIDEPFFIEVTDYCIRHYFPKPNYQRVNGKLFFGFWLMDRLINDLGGLENTARVLNDFRKRAAAAGFELHLTTQKSKFPGYKQRDKETVLNTAKAIGLDSFFTYGWNSPKPEVWPVVPFKDFREKAMKDMREESAFSPIPLNFTVSLGWDSSPRTTQSDMYEDVGYPYNAIITGNTPEEIEKAFAGTKALIDEGICTGDFLTVSTWNEWTEGNYLEPDTKYGYAYLEAMKKVFG